MRTRLLLIATAVATMVALLPAVAASAEPATTISPATGGAPCNTTFTPTPLPQGSPPTVQKYGNCTSNSVYVCPVVIAGGTTFVYEENLYLVPPHGSVEWDWDLNAPNGTYTTYFCAGSAATTPSGNTFSESSFTCNTTFKPTSPQGNPMDQIYYLCPPQHEGDPTTQRVCPAVTVNGTTTAYAKFAAATVDTNEGVDWHYGKTIPGGSYTTDICVNA